MFERKPYPSEVSDEEWDFVARIWRWCRCCRTSAYMTFERCSMRCAGSPRCILPWATCWPCMSRLMTAHKSPSWQRRRNKPVRTASLWPTSIWATPITGQSSKACGPVEIALDAPPSWQQGEARMLDHLRLDAVLARLVPGVSTMNVRLIPWLDCTLSPSPASYFRRPHRHSRRALVNNTL